MRVHSTAVGRRGYAARTWMVLVMAFVLVAGMLAPAPARADGEVTPTDAPAPASLGVAKSVVEPGPFEPGQAFTYRIGYSCSSNTASGCLDAVLTDALPANLELVTDPASLSTSRRTVSYDGSNLVVTFTDPLPAFGDGAVGLAVGNTVSFDVQVRFRNGVVDGETAENCVSLAAANAATVGACATATAIVVPATGANLSKSLSPTSGVASTSPTTTMTLQASVGGEVAASRLVVEDPTGGTDPFDRFDLVSYGPVSLPSGVLAEVVVDGVSHSGPAASIAETAFPAGATSFRVEYTGDLTPGTSIAFPVDLELRSATRSGGTPITSGSINNCAALTASFDGRDDVAVSDRCASYTVIPSTPGAAGSKSFQPAQAVAGSGSIVDLVMSATNASQVEATSVVVTDPTNGVVCV